MEIELSVEDFFSDLKFVYFAVLVRRLSCCCCVCSLDDMSRLLVKNLPSYATPTRLREHFEQQKGPGGTLTDVKVAHKRDGTSRRFGFIGYKTEAEASAAKDWFDRTFLDSSRLSVTIVEV